MVDSAVDAFLAELENMGRADDVVLMCITDFGRRIEECGIGDTAGSDHGAANSMMLFGKPVHAGLHGGQPDLDLPVDHQRRRAHDGEIPCEAEEPIEEGGRVEEVREEGGVDLLRACRVGEHDTLEPALHVVGEQ